MNLQPLLIKIYSLILLFISACHCLYAQLSDPELIGYWHNWNDVNAPYLPLDSIDSRYSLIVVAFAVPKPGTDYSMEFVPDQVTPAVFISQIQNLQLQGRKVLLSIGGANATVSLDNSAERDTFISTVGSILNLYGFDGIDIDLEGNSVTVSGGTIAVPADVKIVNLIFAIKQIMADYFTSTGKRMVLTMAPETAFVQGGMSAYGGIWGAYLPVIDALRDSIELLHVQLYNSGSMYGIDGNIYLQGTADFIVAMTEAVIQGFNTGGGYFAGLPANKIAVGLPACPSASGGGFSDTATVKAAIDYLMGNGSQPGTYTMIQTAGYPTLRGMMTWSINWDAVNTCATAYEYAENFENIFGNLPAFVNYMLYPSVSELTVYPNPTLHLLNVEISVEQVNGNIQLYNSAGTVVLSLTAFQSQTFNISHFSSGIYLVKFQDRMVKFVKR